MRHPCRRRAPPPPRRATPSLRAGSGGSSSSALEHEILSPAADFALSEDDLLVRRDPVRGLRFGRPHPAALPGAAPPAGGRRGRVLCVPRLSPRARGLRLAVWELARGVPRLWLTRTPASVRSPVDTRSPRASAAAATLLFARPGGRTSPGAARELLAALTSRDAASRRGEHWVAEVFRTFPALAEPAAAPARERTFGLGGHALRSSGARALAEKALAIFRGRAPRVFEPGPSPLTPGGALRLTPPVEGTADAARRLRALAVERDGRSPVWIAACPETWDPVSRRAFDSARRSLGDAVEVVVVPEHAALPGFALGLAAGRLGAVRKPRRLGALLRVARGGGRSGARSGPLPSSPYTGLAGLGRVRLRSDRRRAASSRQPSKRPPRSHRRLLARSRPATRASGSRIFSKKGSRASRCAKPNGGCAAFRDAPPEAWFALAARLQAAVPPPLPPWLEAIEAEREIAGGRPQAARARLERVGPGAGGRRRSAPPGPAARSPRSPSCSARPPKRRVAPPSGDGCIPARPPAEAVRALRLGAAGFAREGRVDCALALLDEAERLGSTPPPAKSSRPRSPGPGSCRSAGASRRRRRSTRRSGPGRSAAATRASRPASSPRRRRGLLDRREYARAIVRLEEAIGAEGRTGASARRSARPRRGAVPRRATRPDSETALGDALVAAASAGREDLAGSRGATGRASREPMRVRRRGDGNRGAPGARARGDRTSRGCSSRCTTGAASRCGAASWRSPRATTREARRLAEEIGRPARDRRALARGRRSPPLRGRPRRRARGVGESGRRRPRTGRTENARPASGSTEASWIEAGGPPERGAAGCRSSLRRGIRIPPPSGWPAGTASSAAIRYRGVSANGRPAVLRESGGSELAARVFGLLEPVPQDALRQVRGAAIAVLAGEPPDLDGALPRPRILRALRARRLGPRGSRPGRCSHSGGSRVAARRRGRGPLRPRSLADASARGRGRGDAAARNAAPLGRDPRGDAGLRAGMEARSAS